jgi:Family of unknown function (DUF6055)
MLVSLIMLFVLNQTVTEPFTNQIENAYKSGNISLSQKIQFLENSVKNPSSLPLLWQEKLSKSPISPNSATSILVDMFQLRKSKGIKEDHPDMPPELAFHLDSAIYPLRVYYDTESLLNSAQIVLESAEEAWLKQVDGWAFYAPPIVTPEARYRLYLMDSGMGGGGYTAPIGINEETEWDDCVTYIVIDHTNDNYSIPSTTTHEFNHATQAAMDCMEPSSFWENTATYMMIAVYPQAINYVQYFLPDFQEYHYWSLYDGDHASYYYYGGFIWPLFLSNRYGSGDYHDATLIREIWEASMQSSNFTSNAPNYINATDDVLKEKEVGTFTEAFNHFSKARYFFGPNTSNDYSEIPNSSNYTDLTTAVTTLAAEVEAEYVSDLATSPKPLGVNYILIENPSGYERNTTLELKPSSGSNPWILQLISLKTDKVLTMEAEDGRVSMTYDASEFGNSLLVVQHMVLPGFSAVHSTLKGVEYSLKIYPTIPLPKITMITPDALLTHKTYDISVRGSGFMEGLQLEITPVDQITINSVEFSDSNKFSINITVSDTAMSGPYNLSIVNPDDGALYVENAFSVTANPDPPTDDDSSSDCTCNAGGKTSTFPPFFLMFAVIGILFRFRKSVI